MAKEITITMTDAAFNVLKKAYSYGQEGIAENSVDEAFVKARLIKVLKGKVSQYDKAKTEVTYTSFNPS